jgi:predicted nucleotidyltransferase
MGHRTNITRIKAVNNALGNLKDDFVFVGGATVSLYADRMAEEVRPTDDIDILVELWSRKDYAILEDKLRQLGFVNDTSAKFIGRYIIQGVVVDLMPTLEDILGFSNIWYGAGFKAAIEYRIDEFHTVKIFPSPYFIASKIEAFKNRGENDGRTSSDFEDIIFVLENRNSVWDEMNETDSSLKDYLKKEFTTLLQNQYLEEWIDAHASFNSPPSTYYILQKLNEFIKNTES